MRKLLTCTTALSMALSSFSTLPARAQTVAEDGSILAEDGTILCSPTAEKPCDPAEFGKDPGKEDQKKAEDAVKAAEEEAEKTAKEAEQRAEEAVKAAEKQAAEAEKQAAEAAKQADEAARAAEEQAEAEAKAADEKAAAAVKAAEEEAAAQAAKAAEEQAAAEAKAAEAAKAAEDQAAEAAKAAEEQAAAEAKAAEAAKAAEDQAAAEAKAAEAAKAAEDQAAAEAKAAEAAKAAEDQAAAETKAAEAAKAAEDQAAAEAKAAEAAKAAEEDAAKAAEDQAAAEADAKAAAEAKVTEPVDVPVVPETAAEGLAEILALPSSTDGESGVALEGLAAAAAAAAGIAPVAPEGEAAATDPAADPAAPPVRKADEPVSVTSEVVSEDNSRRSDEEFAAAPVKAEDGKKKDKLSDLEKVGLLALGALVVGAVINEGKKDQKQVVENTGDRVIVQNPDGSYTVYKDDDAILRQPGVSTRTETYGDGSTRTVVQREDGSQVVTVRDASGRVLRRSVFDRSGIETVLINDLAPEEPIIISELPRPRADAVTISTSDNDAALKAEMAALEAENLGRKFSLRQIRDIREVRALAATVEVDTITFDTGSAVIRSSEARKLADLGRLMGQLLAQNPSHVFLIEGHTDAVGSASSNLLLSDRRAESLAKALTEYFDIPPENLVVQGYGESELKIESLSDERANRRVNVRLITPLMRTADLR
ncbi:OmpA family protein [Xinfangfangia pollutisoli]|uniref:OmpA family protein n=1 Tax=Xinfangfangia pollutisoli TaxID=2865960 RepID=UPI001CD6123A|nr:OmpA family protein [Xinfangfangia pollutisoli]